MIYLHVMNKPGLAVKSPADTLKGSGDRPARSLWKLESDQATIAAKKSRRFSPPTRDAAPRL
jgi:hypothetical protein